MTTMISEVFEAFRDAGVSEEKARKAAEALASESLATKHDIASLKTDNAVIKWMVGFNLAFTMAVLWKVLG
ncbi:integrase [Denitratisoma oestradiolicum]|uniref:Integrase n=1 Tax=Denitratisoma oestradiolicum TaxID=311182 RepID=A0A6S6XRH8_9PROT|nr:integrase [Denitratisoma oestradiolicum]TWO80956.1 integrase [Denitratisoma oestradiolicum]CAB1367270.1 Integrase [Denitratisoma oestradiolicum]